MISSRARSLAFCIVFVFIVAGCGGGAAVGPSPATLAVPPAPTAATPSSAAGSTASPGGASSPVPSATATATSSSAPPAASGSGVAPMMVTVGTGGNEPILAAAPDGTLYIAALTNLYRSRDGGATWKLAPAPTIAATVLASDSSIDVAPSGRLYYSFDYPYAGSTAVCTSDDRGDTWACDPAVAPGGTDRMWVTAPGDKEAYETTNEGLYQTAFLSSGDGGATWQAQQLANNTLQPTTGPLTKIKGSNVVLQVVDQHPGRFVYRYIIDATGVPKLANAVSTGIAGGGALPSSVQDTSGNFYLVGEAPNPAHGLGIQIGRSSDAGLTYTALPLVPQTTTGTATFTWLAAGKPGHLVVIYYYATANSSDPTTMNVPWSARVAETFDSLDAMPTWTVTTLEPIVHTGGVCASAGCTGDTRYSGDLINAVIDANEHVNLTWMDEPSPANMPTVRFARLR